MARMDCPADTPHDHPIFVLVLGKYYCAHCWFSVRRALPFRNGRIAPAIEIG